MSRQRGGKYCKQVAIKAEHDRHMAEKEEEREEKGIKADASKRISLKSKIEEFMKENKISDLEVALDKFVDSEYYKQNFGYFFGKLTREQMIDNLRHRYTLEKNADFNRFFR